MNEYFRFLLSKSKWRYDRYINNRVEAINDAIVDLNPSSSELSVYKIENNIYENNIKEIEIISFIFSATTRKNCNDLLYTDLSIEEIKKLNLQIKQTPSDFNYTFYSNKHYNIYPITESIRYKIAEIIFNKISGLPNKELYKITKKRFKELINLINITKQFNDIDYNKFYPWAKP